MPKWLAPQTLFVLLKSVAIVHLAALFGQPILFGQYFSGNAEALALHATMGEAVVWLAAGQALLSVVLWLRSVLRPAAAVAFVAIFVFEGLQIHLGYTRVAAVHIPLGTALLAIALVATLWLWRGASLQSSNDSVRAVRR